MKAKKQIIAVGGGGFSHNEDIDLDQFFLDQISKENCSKSLSSLWVNPPPPTAIICFLAFTK